MTRIACIGEAMIELSITQADAQVGVAGDTLNTAIYAKRLAPDLEVDYITCLGDDPMSQRIFDFISDHGIGTSALGTIPGASPGLYAITTSEAGERSFTYWRSESAARKLFADCDFGVLAKYDALYLSGISVAILPHPVRLALLDWLAANPVKLIYDSNYRPKLWDSVEHARLVTSLLWQRADIALPSIDDEMTLFGETADQVIDRFANPTVVGALKRGEKGPLSIGQIVRQSYAPVAHVVDTTAAGDSFNGGYLAALLSGRSQEQALMAGHQMASVVVQYRGAIIPE
ncbi:sugar kinase [Ruegeria meonggei]|uniref:2-dehydro-3-deoxygluconokinase n=1 Tax=Ruegeria meonggei TaxID=1446476 RepID=A0A1X6YVS8_9RHOB|nr:sugar kinase [Ruegeria meonggei]SLN32247.1 2-dehydro-3-deoxygluconokinase [Ruegeria meonggei]